MSYVCEVCREAVPPGQKRLVHVVRRAAVNPITRLSDGRQEVAREIPVCKSCKAGFQSGYSLEQMMRIVGPKATMPEPLKDHPRVALQASAPPTRTLSTKQPTQAQGA